MFRRRRHRRIIPMILAFYKSAWAAAAGRLVSAEGAGPHGPIQMTAELRVQLGDLLDGFAHAPLHDDPRAFGSRARPALTATEPDRTGDLIGQRVELVAQAASA